MMRTSTRTDCVPPTGRISWSWSTRSSLLWSPSPMSPISSRKSVPPCARSKRPRFEVWAPVKAPRTCPKSSLSSRPSGIAVQLIGTKGLSARAVEVEGLRDQLLARAALPGDEHVAAPVRHAPDQGEDLAHRRALADQLAERAGAVDRAPQAAVLLLERPPLEGALDREQHGLRLEGLGHVVAGAGAHRLDGRVDAAERRHQHHRRLGAQPAEVPDHLDAGLSRHLDVAQHDAVVGLAQLLEGERGARRLGDGEPALAEERGEHLAHGGVVGDAQDARGFGHHRSVLEHAACQRGARPARAAGGGGEDCPRRWCRMPHPGRPDAAARASAAACGRGPAGTSRATDGGVMRVRDLMTAEVTSLGRNDVLSIAADVMRLGRIRHLPVLDEDGALVGIVSQRDLFRGALARALGYGAHAQQKILGQILVKEVMTNDPVTIGPDAPLADAARLMLQRKIGCLVVVEDGRLAGILTESDFVKRFADG